MILILAISVLVTVMNVPIIQIVNHVVKLSIGKMKYVCQMIAELNQEHSLMEQCAKIVYQDVIFVLMH